MGIDCKNISLDQLKNDIKSLEGQQLSDYFDNKLSMAAYRDKNGYSIIIEFFNHLKDEYNQCVIKGNGEETGYHDTLFKTFSWFLPLLHPCHKIIVQSNVCILADDKQDIEFHEKYFKNSLKSANRLIEIAEKQLSKGKGKDRHEKEALCWVLDSIGHLNIREHNYESAILCLRMCLDLLSTLNVETSDKLYKLYIESIVRLANCYEYTDRPWCAINCMLDLGNLINGETAEEVQRQQANWKKVIENNADKIRSKIITYYSLPESKLTNKDDTIDIVMEIFDLFFEKPKENHVYSILKWTTSPELHFKTLKNYIHVLAHCISEYAAKIRVANYSHPFCSTLQLISRFFLDWLVVTCDEEALVTCQATVRAENDACPEALKLLLKRYSALEKRLSEGICTVEEQNERHEIEFFLFYFAEQELRYNYKDQALKNVFDKFSSKFFESASNEAKNGDYDLLFHFYVIRFKYLFKQKIDEFIKLNSDDSKLEMAEVDRVFLSMCRCKGLCSDQIFKGLLDECQRLEELFALFQQLQWLNSKTISKEKLNLFKQLWELHNRNDKTFDVKKIVSKIYDEIIKRNKILILAPIKNAPSCSSEYQNIRCLLELPISTGETSYTEGDRFLSSFNSILRKRSQTAQYFLNPNNEYSTLKWAIYYPYESSFAYLYYQKANTIDEYNDEIEYSGVFPVYLDKEHEAIKDILKKIDDVISDEFVFSLFSKDMCVHRRCADDSPCNTFLLKPDDECNLRMLIYELLTFLEFDFHAAQRVGRLGKEYLLISYPKKGAFKILAFDEQLPVWGSKKDLCSICDQCFTNLAQGKSSKTNGIGHLNSVSCEFYTIDMLVELRKKVYIEIDQMEISTDEKKLIKAGEETSYKTTTSEQYARLCFCLNKCINGKCNKLQEPQCETCKLLYAHHFI